MVEPAHISAAEVAIRLLVAGGLASGIGLEREINQQPAGFRTHMLLGLGAALFTVAGARVVGTDPTRVAAQVVSGIGFLGAGAILREGGSIKGLTTAASVWVTAAVGLACGLGEYYAALVTTVAALTALVIMKRVERTFFPRVRADRVRLDIEADVSLSTVVGQARRILPDAGVVNVAAPSPGVQQVELLSHLGVDADVLAIAEQLRALDGVRGVEVRA